MKQALLICDDFAPPGELLAIRNEVVSGEFKTVKGPDGFDYTGIQEKEYPLLLAATELVVGRKIEPWRSGFRLNLAGEIPHSWIHSDDLCAQYASVLYMNLPGQCKGGTAFWKHCGIGIDRMPTKEELEAVGYDVGWFCKMMQREWEDLTYWEQSAFAGMKWNRFVTYPTSMFHSRYPFEGFGTTPEDGRLVWVCFFNVLPREPLKTAE